MNRILLTGATGFIGSAVLRHLVAEGADVLALRGQRPPPLDHPRVAWKQLDLLASTEAGLAEALAGEGLTHCIHTAWYTNHSDYLEHPVNHDWVRASQLLAKSLNKNPNFRFVALGTLQEYSAHSAIATESTTPLHPETLYARCKLELCDWLSDSGIDFAWPRVFFTYGPGDRAGRLVPNMIEHFSRGEAVGPKFGGLRRDYIHVDDLAGQLTQIAMSQVSGPINTGTGEAPTLSEIYVAGAHAFGRPELALANDETGDQPPLIVADLNRFRREVGELATRGLDQGLADLIEGNP